jgi:uncharacterized protein
MGQTGRKGLKLRRLAEKYAICRFHPGTTPLPWAQAATFLSVTRTEDELSIVCPVGDVPSKCRAKAPWIGFKLLGSFTFYEFLTSVVEPLAEADIPIFVISTYDTDYVFVKEELAEAAAEKLQQAGHRLVS